MKSTLLFLLGLLTPAALVAEVPKRDPESKKLRQQCHAHFCYTAALSEEDSKTRMKLLDRSIELDPQLARAFYNRGVLHVRNKDLAKGKADFQKAIDLNPDYIFAHYNLACVLSLQGQLDKALDSLEKALAKGYPKLDKIAKDPDFDNLKKKAAFGQLIAKYQKKAGTRKLSPLQRIQIVDVEEYDDLLSQALGGPRKQAGQLAAWVMQDPHYEIRAISMVLWRKLDLPESKTALLRGLYDVNGYVKKAAAKGLIEYGKAIGRPMAWIIKDKGTEGPFYAMQILAAIKAPKAVAQIVPLLRDDDRKVRIMAAECLARLEAVSALPQLEAALANPPKKGREDGFYQAALRRAIRHLKQLKKEDKK